MSTSILHSYLSTLPEITLPSRRAALYADLSSLKETNPISFERSMIWWRKAIIGCVQSGASYQLGNGEHGVFHVSAQELEEAFKRDGIRPASLIFILETMEQEGHLRRLESYAPWIKTWSGWAWYAVSSLTRRLTTARTLPTQQFVVCSVLEEASKQAWNIYQELVTYQITDRLYTWREFKEKFNQGWLNQMLNIEQDWQLLVVQLEEDHRIIVERDALHQIKVIYTKVFLSIDTHCVGD
jgi:hypothetical protein